MDLKPVTFQMDKAERIALETISETEGRSMGQLLNEAVKCYLSRWNQKEAGLHTTLKNLQQYRKKNAGFQQAIAELVQAEATLNDPLEGEPMAGSFVGGQFEPAGPVQSKIRKLLNA